MSPTDFVETHSDLIANHLHVRSHSLLFPNPGAEPIIFLHGANSDPEYWLPVADRLDASSRPLVGANGLREEGGARTRLRADYELHLLALPGFGKTVVATPGAVLSLSVADTLTFLIEYVREYASIHLPNRPFRLVGHSFGGYLASAFGCRYSQLTASITLINGAGILPLFGEYTTAWAMFFKWILPFLRMGRLDAEHRAQRGAERTTSDGLPKAAPPRLGERIVAKFVHFDGSSGAWKHTTWADMHSTSRPAYAGRSSEPLAAGAARVSTPNYPPLGLIWGDCDSITPIEIARFLAEGAGRGEVLAVSGGGHCVMCSELGDLIIKSFTTHSFQIQPREVEKLRPIIDDAVATWSGAETLQRRTRLFKTLRTAVHVVAQN